MSGAVEVTPEERAKAATKARFVAVLATEDQRNGYEVGYYEATLATEAAFKAREAELVEVAQRAVTALTNAEAWFESYSELHRAKGTADGGQKAAINLARSMDMGEAAEELENAILARTNATPDGEA
jgi:hypothetical protein